jgi:Tol biopolymer transport system component
MSAREQQGRARPYHGAMTNATGRVRTGTALAVLAVFGWLGGCSDNPVDPTGAPPPDSLIVSDEVPTSVAAHAAPSGLALSSVAAEAVVYVSLPPNAAPAGRTATIRRVGDAASVITTVSGGGFDPVAVNAGAGDFIDVIIRNAAGAAVLQARLEVARRRPPVVVRTNPPRKKTDVPLNAAIVVVFSEPIAEGTLTASSFQLFRGSTPVTGTVRLLAGAGTVAAFVPSAPLARNSAYHLTVTGAVQDLQGDALQTDVTVPFTTGASSTGPPASIAVAPDSVFITGATYQMTATVRDAAGNQLIDQPVTWTSSDPANLTVSATGLLTVLSTGVYDVTAAANGLSATARVIVVPGPAASLEVAPTDARVGAQGDTIHLIATVRDAGGRVLVPAPTVTWASSDPAVATARADSAGVYATFATVTGQNVGSAIITGTSGGASATVSVTVVPPLPAQSVTVSPNPATVLVRGTRQLFAAVRDANGKALGGRVVTWTSENPAVATVDSTGVVTAVVLGSTAVTATSEGLSDTTAVTVEPPLLLFVSSRGGNTDIYGMSADGSAQINVTQSAQTDHSPAWSPDGQNMAFVHPFGVYVMSINGGTSTPLFGLFAVDVDLPWSAWSPDGRKVLFSGRLGPSDIDLRSDDIYAANADGSGLTRLTEYLGRDYGPAWSPDGQKIAFTSERDGNAEIYVMNADGSVQTRLTNRAGEDKSPEWSPDGGKILFTSYQNNKFAIYVMNPDGSGLARLTNSSGWDFGPAWSPNGQKIAFVSTRDGNNEIYVMNADGSAQTNLTNHPGLDGPISRPEEDLAWSPDGQRIAFVSLSLRDGSSQLYVMNADGSARTLLTTNSWGGRQPRWRP